MYLIFDIGGTKMRLAISSNDNSFGEPEIIQTPKDFDEGMAEFKRAFNKLSQGNKVEKAAGGIRRLDPKHEHLLADFRLPDWSDKPLKKKLTEIVGAPVYLENDTAMVGLGEAIVGAGKGFDIVAYLTISTGVGGARIVKQKIDVNSLGFEPGHQIIDADWSLCADCQKISEGENLGQLEAYISGTSIEKRFGKKPYEITDNKLWDELAKLLSYGLNNTIVHWSPDVVVLGGGMMKTPGIAINRVKDNLAKLLAFFPNQPEIKKAQLGDVGGLHGALYYLNQLQDNK